jgi:hypothetical protein
MAHRALVSSYERTCDRRGAPSHASRYVRDRYFVTVTVKVVEWVRAPAAETSVKVMEMRPESGGRA